MQRPTRVLFLYPNERGMSTVPPSIALFSQILKDAGHVTGLFDTTFYKFDDELNAENVDVEQDREAILSVRPTLDQDDEDLHFKKTTRSAINDFAKEIKSFKPDLIAVTVTETTFYRGYKLIQGTRDLGIPNLFGGVFPTFAPELVMTHEDVDSLCVGEGENALLEVADLISEGKTWENATNLWVRSKPGKEIIKNRVSKPVDINKLPAVTDIGIFGESRFYRPMGGKVRRLLPVETHRGCPYTCSFCNSPSQNRLYGDGDFNKGLSFFRKKSMELIKEEIENHIKEWKVEYIYFWADTFLTWSKPEFEEFCEMYSDIKLPFWCQTRIETITRDKFSMLVDAGLHRITFGMEHGNEEFRRKVVKRDYTNASAIKKMAIIEEFDVPYSVNNIIGFPDETRELAFDTIEINRQFNSDSLSCSTLVPFHGTELRDVAEAKGYISPGQIASVSNSDASILDMPQWSKAEISALARTFAMYVKFPKDRWPEIEKAEYDSELHAKLSEEYIEAFWSDPSAKIEDDLAEAARGIF